MFLEKRVVKETDMDCWFNITVIFITINLNKGRHRSMSCGKTDTIQDILDLRYWLIEQTGDYCLYKLENDYMNS